MLTTASNPGDTSEILLGEDGVIVCKKSGSLPLRQRIRQEGGGGVAAAIEAESYSGCAGVIGVLNNLLEDSGALGVVEQDLPDAPSEVNFLTEILDEDGRGVHHRRD